MPRWVKVCVVIVAVLVVAVLVSKVLGFDHGPGMHGGRASPAAVPVPIRL